MLHQSPEKTQATNVRRWKAERGGLLWSRAPSVIGNSFDEDLALFERQVREEAGEGDGCPAGLVSHPALSA